LSIQVIGFNIKNSIYTKCYKFGFSYKYLPTRLIFTTLMNARDSRYMHIKINSIISNRANRRTFWFLSIQVYYIPIYWYGYQIKNCLKKKNNNFLTLGKTSMYRLLNLLPFLLDYVFLKTCLAHTHTHTYTHARARVPAMV
jgi:hypothetical protein